MFQVWKILRWGVVIAGAVAIIWALQPAPTRERPVAAQSPATCDQLIEDALVLASNVCLEMGRNEACFGHAAVGSILTNENALFERPGDIIPVEEIETLITRPLDPTTGDWGIVMMDVQADLPDTSEAQVRLLLFGGVEIAPVIQAKTAPTTFCQVENTSGNPLPLRSGPGPQYPIIDIFDVDATLPFSGRDENGAWLHSTAGWVLAEDVTTECPTADLTLISDVTDAYLAPMQAFTLQMDSAASCAAAPSGLLIQAPEGQTANLLVNNVQLRIGSTALLVPDGESWQVANLEGEVIVSVAESSAIVPPGAQVEVPLDETGQAAGTLSEVVPFDESLQSIHEELPAALPESVEIPDPATSLILSFTADSTVIEAGECTILRWEVDSSITANIWLELGSRLAIVGNTGERSVCPTTTTTYGVRIPPPVNEAKYLEIVVVTDERPTPTATATRRPNSTLPPSRTPSQTSSPSASPTPSITRTLPVITPTNTNRPSQTSSPTNTLRPTNSPSPSPLPSQTPSRTNAPTHTASPFPSNTSLPTHTPRPTDTAFPSFTPSRTPPPTNTAFPTPIPPTATRIPVINFHEFNVNPNTIQPEGCVRVTWSVSGDFMRIFLTHTGGEIQVGMTGNYDECLTASFTYRLRVEDLAGQMHHADATVTVQ